MGPMRTISINVFLMLVLLRNIQVTYTHAQLKGGNKEPYRIGLKLSNGGWVYVQGLTHYEVNEHDEFLIAGFNYEGQLAAANLNYLQHANHYQVFVSVN